jgi:hypothetical protein
MLIWGCQNDVVRTTPAGKSSARPALDPADLTPELIAASKKLLKEHQDSPIGTEFVLHLHGEEYLVRIERHEDAERGKHKGVSVYTNE